MATRKTYTTRGTFVPQGRRSTIFGEKTHTKFVGGGFTVEYELVQRKKGDEVFVTVTMEGHAPITWQCMGLVPSPDIAKIHAASAFRTHFNIRGGGDPHETKDASRLSCSCPAF